MDLRKNLPVQNDLFPPVNGAKQTTSAFDKIGNFFGGLMAALTGLIFMLIMFFSGSSSDKAQKPVETKQVAETKTPTAQPQQNLADANVQQNSQPQQKPVEQKPQATQTQQKPVEQKVQTTQPQQKPKPTPPTSLPQMQEKPAASNSQTVRPQQKPTPPTSLPQQKPVSKPVSPPPVSKPAVAAASAGKSSSWLKTAGKIGIGIITKGKVKIR